MKMRHQSVVEGLVKKHKGIKTTGLIKEVHKIIAEFDTEQKWKDTFLAILNENRVTPDAYLFNHTGHELTMFEVEDTHLLHRDKEKLSKLYHLFFVLEQFGWKAKVKVLSHTGTYVETYNKDNIAKELPEISKRVRVGACPPSIAR